MKSFIVNSVNSFSILSFEVVRQLIDTIKPNQQTRLSVEWIVKQTRFDINRNWRIYLLAAIISVVVIYKSLTIREKKGENIA